MNTKMRPNLSFVINRFDIEAYQIILGAEIIGTLNLLGPQYSYSKGLNKILLNTYSFQELLSNHQARKVIIYTLRKEEVLLLLDKYDYHYNTGDPWEIATKLSSSNHYLKLLFDFFNITIEEIEKPDWIQEEVLQPNYSLYPYQRKVLQSLDTYLNSSKNRILLHMPTGSGKTRTTINYICRYFLKNPNTNVVWFANTVELLDQAYEEFKKGWENIGDRELKILKFWGKSNLDISKIKNSFIVAGLGKTYGYLMKDISKMSEFANNTTLVVMDEAHQAIAPSYELLLRTMLIVNNSSLIGLSATPGRTWNEPDEDRKLANFFYGQKVKLRISGYENPVDYLVDQGYLAKVVNNQLFYDAGIKLSKTDFIYLKTNFVLPKNILEKFSENKARNLFIVSKIKQLIERHQRIILFSINVSHAKVLNSLLTAINIESSVLTSDTDAVERKKIIENFKVSREKNPNPIVLCNYGILTTGFDAPETSCAVISRPTDSLVLYSQMVGRAIRGEKSGGNKEAEIVTVVDKNLPGFGSVSEAFTNWDDVWEEIN